MSLPFCSNPACRLHSVKISGPEFDCVDYEEANGKKVRSYRKTILVKDTGKRFDFCGSCMYVAIMVNEPPNEPRTSVKDSAPGDTPEDVPTSEVHSVAPPPQNIPGEWQS